MPTLSQITDPPQAHVGVVLNENFEATEHQAVYGKNAAMSGGLVWGYHGGRWGGFSVAAGTLALTANATNYVVVDVADGSVSVSDDDTDWTNATDFVRVYQVTTDTSSAAAVEDHRAGPGGVHGGTGTGGGGGGTALADGDYGDVIVSASGTALAIDADAVTNAKAANMATATIKGRATSGTGDPEDLTAAQAAAILQGDGLTGGLAGFRNIPQNSQNGAYTLVAADSGKHIFHPSADPTARIFTIPANASVAFPVGTAVTFVNQNAAGVITIAIASDTMRLAGDGSTGSRTLAANGIATALKVASTEWLISGTGLT